MSAGAASGAPVPASQTSPSLVLHLLLQFVEEAPVGPLRDELLGTGLDHPGFVQPEGMEAHGILRIILAPAVVRDLLQSLEDIVVALCRALVDEEAGDPLRLQ